MKSFGIIEDLPKSKKHLVYEQLNLKSIRILNRISHYFVANDIDVDDFFKDLNSEHMVKTKTKQEKVEIMKAELFFKKLHTCGIIKKPDIHYNLS